MTLTINPPINLHRPHRLRISDNRRQCRECKTHPIWTRPISRGISRFRLHKQLLQHQLLHLLLQHGELLQMVLIGAQAILAAGVNHLRQRHRHPHLHRRQVQMKIIHGRLLRALLAETPGVATLMVGNKASRPPIKMQFRIAGQLLRSRHRHEASLALKSQIPAPMLLHQQRKLQGKNQHRQALEPGERKEIQAVRGDRLRRSLTTVGVARQPEHRAEAGVNRLKAMPGAATKPIILSNNSSNSNNSNRLHRRHQQQNQPLMPGR